MTESARPGTLDSAGATPREDAVEIRERERSSQPEICVVVPVCEQPESITELYHAYRGALESMDRSYEFLFVIEPWARTHVEPLVRLAADGHPVRVLEGGHEVGESMLLRAAVARSRAPIFITIPPYPRIAPESLSALVDRVDSGVDLVSARRDTSGVSRLNLMQRSTFHWLLRRGIGGDFRDVASGVRVMRRIVLEEAPLHGDLYRFLPVLADCDGFTVEEVTVPSARRERSRIHTPGTYVRRLLDLLGLVFLVRFTQKPLRFFGLLGGLLSGLGSVILLVLLVQRLGGQSLADRPLMLLGVLLAVLGVQAVALGLVGEIVVHLDSLDRPTYRLKGGSRRTRLDRNP